MTWRPANQDLDGFDKIPLRTNQTSTQPNLKNTSSDTDNIKAGINKSEDVRRDTDDIKDFSIKIIDIDNCIFEYLQKMNLMITAEDKSSFPVPIMFSSPEAWKSIQKDGFMRDQKGQIQLPLLMMKRNSLQRNEQLKTFNRYGKLLSMPFVRKYSDKNQYDQFSAMNNLQAPVKEIYNVNLPDHYIINYEFIIWTDLVSQSNQLLERISYASEDYWGDEKRFKFRTSIPEFNNQAEISAEETRVIKTTFSMQVFAYLLPEYYKDWEKTTRKSFTKRRVVFDIELEESVNNFPTESDFKGYTGQGKVGNIQPKNKNTVRKTIPANIISIENSNVIIELPNTSFVSGNINFFIDGYPTENVDYNIVEQKNKSLFVEIRNQPINQNTPIIAIGNFE